MVDRFMSFPRKRGGAPIIAAAERHVMKYEFIDQETLTLKDDVLEQHNLCVQQYESSSGQKHIDLHLAEEGLCIAFFAQVPVGVGCVHTSDISSVEGLSEAALECIIQILQFSQSINESAAFTRFHHNVKFVL